MGHSQAEKLATHRRIVDIASRRFKEVGLDGISVADIMTEAGLTVGGFYKHFASRDELVVEALVEALAARDDWELSAKSSLRKAIRTYLSEEHRDDLAGSCALASLVNDVSRSGDDAREAYMSHLLHLFDATEGALSPTFAENRRAKAMLILSACIGALALSRSVSDSKVSRQILNGVGDELIHIFVPKKTQT
ncbi:TetR/AcrR family transcriptional regulator [Paraburkholderia caribensis]|uniref:TetR/AcrR family transcriptional regulator n=1 Tax=Paraburkholderia caribensis TaxID=75105 RepID=UPI0034D1AC03